MKRILFYTNQFFGQVGGEDKAGMKPVVMAGAIGAANLFKDKIADTDIIATVICGDNYYAENIEKSREYILEEVKRYKPDILVAGPAFNAGRFGIACADICKAVSEQLDIPVITGLYIENPAVLIYRGDICIAETGKSAADMKNAVPKMVELAKKLLHNEKLGLPEEEGYIPRGIRVNIFKEKTGAERALDALVAKLNGRPYKTEVPIPVYQSITPAPGIKDLKKAKIAIITTGGVVPMGNPDHLPAATAKFYKKYDISAIDSLRGGEFESVHAGYDPVYANQDPNRVVPLDVLKELEKGGEIGEIHTYLFTTTGNSTSVADATRMGKEIAEELLAAGVNGVIMTST
jgi:glycine reductase complex component B subunit gamma